MKSKKIKIIWFLFIVILFFAAAVIYFKIYKNTTPQNVEKINTIDNIDNFDYVLNSNASQYYKTLFKELKEILTKETPDEETHAKKIAQLFITDLFTLSNKISSSDIGGVQFVYKDFQDDFISIAQSGLYSSIKNNVYGDRKQQLPEVTDVTILETIKKDFKYKNTTLNNSYYIKVEIKYKENLGYPSKYQVVISKNEKLLEVVKAQELK